MITRSFLCHAGVFVLSVAVVTSFSSTALAGPPEDEHKSKQILEVPSVEEAYELQGGGEWEDAAYAWKQIAKADPENATAWFNLGYSLHAAGNLEDAIKAHKKASTFDEYHGIALYNLGCAFALMGKPDQAFKALFASQEAGFRMRGQAEYDTDLDSLRDDPRYEKLLSNEKSEVDESIDHFMGILNQYLDRLPEIQQQVSMIVQEIIVQALQALDQLSEELSNDEELADIVQRLDAWLNKKHAEGLHGDASHEHVAEVSDDLQALIQKAATLQHEGHWKEAAALFEVATQKSPDTAMLWFSYAYCLHMGGEYEKAIDAHKKAAAFDETRGISLYNLACAYSLTGRIDEAMEVLHASHEAGFDLEDLIEDDSDLDNLREDPRFMKLLSELGIEN